MIFFWLLETEYRGIRYELKRTNNWNPPRPKPPVLRPQYAPIAARYHRHNRYFRLYSQMERPLLEPQQHRLLGITPRPLGKNKSTLLLPPHHLRRALKRLQRPLPVRPINENRP